MPGVVDADSHVLEHQGMWENFDEGGKMHPQRPLLVNLPEDTSWGGRNAFWLIDGEMFPKAVGRGAYASHTPTTALYERERTDISLDARQLTDITPRLRDMDARGVEVQIVYSTLFLRFGTANADLELAMVRAYNRYMAKACSGSGGRLRFVMVPPLRSIDRCLEELNWANENGAVGVYVRATEMDRSFCDPYFAPVYREASRLNLPICIHTGQARFSTFPVIQGASGPFTDLVQSKLPEQFPDLRFGFIEYGSMWIPETVHRIQRRSRMNYKGPVSTQLNGTRSDANLFKEYRIFVACMADERLPYVLEYTGEDNLLVGSDYSHQDPAEEQAMVEDMRRREDVPREVIEKILCENPRAFYPL